jgi:hypothetical protein
MFAAKGIYSVPSESSGSEGIAGMQRRERRRSNSGRDRLVRPGDGVMLTCSAWAGIIQSILVGINVEAIAPSAKRPRRC